MSNIKLKCAIISEGLTVNTLAKKANVDEQTIRRAIKEKGVKLDTAKAICKALNKTLTELFGGE
jgi:DNA-binding XRE family transcriptional regulator